MSELKSWREIPIAGIPFKRSTDFKTGDWRTFKPIVDHDKCTLCMLCWIYCPDMAIEYTGDKIEVNYDYCKGCGICAHECPVKAIEMVLER